MNQEYINKPAVCSSFTSDSYTRFGKDRNTIVQSTCKKPYLCLECAKRQSKKRAKKWINRIDKLKPSRIEFISINDTDNLSYSQFLSYCQKLIKSMNAKGALLNLAICKSSHNKHIHAIVLDSENPISDIDGQYTIDCQLVKPTAADLERSVMYVLKYPIIDYLAGADNNLISQEYLAILSEFQKVRPTRAIGNLANRCK